MRQLYLDCDGVLADFDKGATALLGMKPKAFEHRHGLGRFWQKLATAPDFYFSLPLMADAMRLFDAVKHFDPIILTGLPRGNWAADQKMRWAAQHFPGVRMITCMARDKRNHAKDGDVLVDDNDKFRHLWEAAGGIFVHHKNAEESLEQLVEYFPLKEERPSD
jgi:5'(3')-deoxyribonucleotidase